MAGGTVGEAIAGTVALPAGGATPLTFALRFSLTGYQVAVRGQASYARARATGPCRWHPGNCSSRRPGRGSDRKVDLVAAGPWIPAEEKFPSALRSPPASPAAAAGEPETRIRSRMILLQLWRTHRRHDPPATDTAIGTVTVHNANWKSDYLANHVEITDATLHLDPSGLRWDPVDFTYGPVTGAATVTVPAACPAQTSPGPCAPQFELQFGGLDAAAFETALLGAKQKGYFGCLT